MGLQTWTVSFSEVRERHEDANARRAPDCATRARQGMVIYVPKGDPIDATRPAAFTMEQPRSCQNAVCHFSNCIGAL